MRSCLWLAVSFFVVACGADGASPASDDAGADAGDPDGGRANPDAMSGADAGDEPCTSCGACVESRAVTSAQHVQGDIDYADKPPLGGNHNQCWTRFGVHEQEVADERWVHNLEHGAVVFLYHCPDACDEEIAALEFLASPRPFVLVMPYAELPTRFGAVAWGHRLLTECFDEAAFESFYDLYADQAPESLTNPPPSGC